MQLIEFRKSNHFITPASIVTSVCPLGHCTKETTDTIAITNVKINIKLNY